MAKVIKVVEPIWIRYKGDFDLQGLVTLIYDWYKRQLYELHESVYKDKAESFRGNETEITWKGEKKVTEYLKYEVKVHLHVFEGKDVQVEKNGKKVTLHRGRFELEIAANLLPDWQKTFEGGKLNQIMGDLYAKIKKREIDMIYADQLTTQVYELHRKIKELAGMTLDGGPY
ncbi:MAG: hypothetical protein ABIA93_02940 [Candidatus Woesearchaeota archaeon]